MNVTKVKKLNLTNKGELSLFFVGTGSAFAKTLYQNNLVIIKGDEHILIDCGAKCFPSLHSVGISPVDIKNIYITHSHADHIGGLEEAMMMGRYFVQRKPNLYITDQYADELWNESLKGGASYSEVKDGVGLGIKDFMNVINPSLRPELGREAMEINLGTINLKMFRTKHIPDYATSWKDSHLSYSVLIDDRIFFSSDTRYDKDLIVELEKDYDIEYYFHDTQLFTGGVHSSLDELTGLPEEIKKKTILMHYADNYKDFEEKRIAGKFHSWAVEHGLYTF